MKIPHHLNERGCGNFTLFQSEFQVLRCTADAANTFRVMNDVHTATKKAGGIIYTENPSSILGMIMCDPLGVAQLQLPSSFVRITNGEI